VDNQQQPRNNLTGLLAPQTVVHNATPLFKSYPQTFTRRITSLQNVLKGLSTENAAFIYDYYFLKV
jgi:hypothetical protein